MALFMCSQEELFGRESCLLQFPIVVYKYRPIDPSACFNGAIRQALYIPYALLQSRRASARAFR